MFDNPNSIGREPAKELSWVTDQKIQDIAHEFIRRQAKLDQGDVQIAQAVSHRAYSKKRVPMETRHDLLYTDFITELLYIRWKAGILKLENSNIEEDIKEMLDEKYEHWSPSDFLQLWNAYDLLLLENAKKHPYVPVNLHVNTPHQTDRDNQDEQQAA